MIYPAYNFLDWQTVHNSINLWIIPNKENCLIWVGHLIQYSIRLADVRKVRINIGNNGGDLDFSFSEILSFIINLSETDKVVDIGYLFEIIIPLLFPWILSTYYFLYRIGTWWKKFEDSSTLIVFSVTIPDWQVKYRILIWCSGLFLCLPPWLCTMFAPH